jgi:hypothetical protein
MGTMLLDVHDEGMNTLASAGPVRRIDRGRIRDLSPVFHHANASSIAVKLWNWPTMVTVATKL